MLDCVIVTVQIWTMYLSGGPVGVFGCLLNDYTFFLDQIHGFSRQTAWGETSAVPACLQGWSLRNRECLTFSNLIPFRLSISLWPQWTKEHNINHIQSVTKHRLLTGHHMQLDAQHHKELGLIFRYFSSRVFNILLWFDLHVHLQKGSL